MSSFFPDAERARTLDARMHSELLSSLQHILESLGELAAPIQHDCEQLMLNLAQGNSVDPATFGLYYEATDALLKQDIDTGLAMLKQLTAAPLTSTQHDITIQALAEVEPESRRVRYQRLMDTDPETPFRLISPDPKVAADDAIRLRRVLDRLQQLIPQLADEFAALVREVILVNGAPGLGYDFAGGSCYMLWGALFLNMSGHSDEVALIEVLAHESAHSLLFGLTIDEPLVLNDERDRYQSPLRDDPRPMDGIYHATYVSARMHWAMSRIASASTVTDNERQQARQRMLADQRSFDVGMQTLQSCAHLSKTGQRLLNDAHRYMTEAVSVS